MTHRERFLNLMEYKPIDRVPNWEVGAWQQTIDRWHSEGLDRYTVCWDWFTGCPDFHLDPREYIHLDTGMKPPFEVEVLERTDRYAHVHGSVHWLSRNLSGGF